MSQGNETPTLRSARRSRVIVLGGVAQLACRRPVGAARIERIQWVIGGPRGAAAKLGLKRTTLITKMKRLGSTYHDRDNL
jgi:transcriptional regulator of acetoin/glycerol metabolism